MEYVVRKKIRILKGGWKIADKNDIAKYMKYVKTLEVKLSIQGDKEGGYHLIEEPDGCFSADQWYKSLEEALEVAHKSWGVKQTDWVNNDFDLTLTSRNSYNTSKVLH